MKLDTRRLYGLFLHDKAIIIIINGWLYFLTNQNLTPAPWQWRYISLNGKLSLIKNCIPNLVLNVLLNGDRIRFCF